MQVNDMTFVYYSEDLPTASMFCEKDKLLYASVLLFKRSNYPSRIMQAEHTSPF